MTIDAPRRLDEPPRPAIAAPEDRGVPIVSPVAATVVAVAITVVLGWFGFGDGLVTSDEGALLGQIHLVQDHGTWAMAHPVPELDPLGRWFPVDQAQLGDDGWAPLAKHPLTTTLLGRAYGAFGVGGSIAVGIGATVGTVVMMGALARRLGARSGSLVMVVGAVCSPLVYDSFVLMGHPLGTLAAGLVSLGVIAAMESDESPPAVVAAWSALAVVAAIAGPMFRNEALLFDVAIAAALLGLAVCRRRRRPPWRTVALGAAVAAGGVAGYLADTAWSSHILGTTRPFRISGQNGLVGRAAGAVSALLLPGDGGLLVSAVVAAGLVGAIVVGRAVRTGTVAEAGLAPADRRRVVVGLALMAGAALVWPLVVDGTLTPGLLVACPVLVVGLTLLRRPAGDLEWLAVVTIALCCAAVLATQYADGGGLQWGGRYLHVVLPLALPLVVLAVADALRRLDSSLRQAVVVGLAVAVAGNLVAMLLAVHEVRRLNTESVTSVRGFVGRHRTDAAPGDGGDPIVVSDVTPLGRLSWDGLPDERRLNVPEEEWHDFGRQLAASPIERIVVATTRPPGELERLLGVPVTVIVDEINAVGTLRLLIVEVDGS